jgi:hypothetical protein
MFATATLSLEPSGEQCADGVQRHRGRESSITRWSTSDEWFGTPDSTSCVTRRCGAEEPRAST